MALLKNVKTKIKIYFLGVENLTLIFILFLIFSGLAMKCTQNWMYTYGSHSSVSPLQWLYCVLFGLLAGIAFVGVKNWRADKNRRGDDGRGS